MTIRQLQFLKFLAFSVFIGRAYQHLFFDIPLRELLWDEGLMKGIVERFTSLSWETYITDTTTDYWIQDITQSFGVFYVLCAIVVIFIQPHQKRLGKVLLAGSVGLILLALLYWKEKFMSIGQFIEYAAQFGMPIFLYFALFKLTEVNKTKFINAIKIAIALTFIGHGLYALGFYPVPFTYTEMMISVFGLSESNAIFFLKIAGIVDLIAAVAIFIPKVEKPFLWYCVIWGTMTALARVVGNFYWEIPWESLPQWWFASFYRLPHGGLALLVLLSSVLKAEM